MYVGDSQSNGDVESAVEQVQHLRKKVCCKLTDGPGQLRKMRSDVEIYYSRVSDGSMAYGLKSERSPENTWLAFQKEFSD